MHSSRSTVHHTPRHYTQETPTRPCCEVPRARIRNFSSWWIAFSGLNAIPETRELRLGRSAWKASTNTEVEITHALNMGHFGVCSKL
jgi:hypothetical protein